MPFPRLFAHNLIYRTQLVVAITLNISFLILSVFVFHVVLKAKETFTTE